VTGEYVRKASVPGIIQPVSGLIKLKSTVNGMVDTVFVTEGEYVEKDQPLIRIKKEKHNPIGEELNLFIVNQYLIQISNLQQRIRERKKGQFLDLEELGLEKMSILNSLSLNAQQYLLTEKRFINSEEIYNKTKNLVKSGYISGVNIVEIENSKLNVEQQVLLLKSEKIVLEGELAQLKLRQKKLSISHDEELYESETSLHQLERQLALARQERVTEIRASKAGTVTGILIKEGQVVEQQQNILTIFPFGSELQAILYVPIFSSGFMQEGLNVKIRYDSFPYQKFGTFNGLVTEVSSTVVLPEEVGMDNVIKNPAYRVIVSLPSSVIVAYGKNFELRAGMTLEADILLEKRSLLHWLFDPLYSLTGKL
jgi:membrane fusion protein